MPGNNSQGKTNEKKAAKKKKKFNPQKLDPNSRKVMAITEMTKHLIEKYEKGEKINFTKVNFFQLKMT